jgi:hypothetical protein
MSDKSPGTHNYVPTPIERLTTNTVEQQMLAALIRIEALLMSRFGGVPQEDPTSDTSPPAKPKTRFSRGK